MYQLRSSGECGAFTGIIMGQQVKPKPTVKTIMRVVADYFGFRLHELKKGTKTKDLALARHIAMYFARELSGKSYPQIAKPFNMDHTSVLYGWLRINDIVTGQRRTWKPRQKGEGVNVCEVREHVSRLRERLEG